MAEATISMGQLGKSPSKIKEEPPSVSAAASILRGPTRSTTKPIGAWVKAETMLNTVSARPSSI